MNARQRWTLILTSVASLMVGLDMLVVTNALNTIRLDLGASIEDLDWTINAYTLTFAVLLMTASVFGDRLGRRRVMAIGLGLFTAASASCALAPDVAALIAARALQGAGSAMIMPQALALLGAAFPPQRRGKAMGIFSGITGLAILGGPVIGGAVVQGLAWQWIFWLNVPIGVVVIPLVLRKVDETVARTARLDVAGLVLSGLGALGLVWGLVRGNAAGWAGAEVVGSLAGGAVMLLAFVAWERRAPAPMLPMGLFANRTFSAANAAGFLLSGSIFGAAFFFAQYLQAGMHDDPLGAGLRLLPWTATLFVIAPVAGALIERVGERPLVVAGLLAQGGGFAWVALVAGSGYGALIAPMVLAGIGVSTAMPAAQNAVVGAVAPEAIGTASGTYNAMRQLGGTFGIAVLSAVFAARGGFATPATVTHGFTATMAVAAVISGIGALSAVGIRAAARPAAAAADRPRVVEPDGIR